MNALRFSRDVLRSMGKTTFSDPDIFILMLGGLLLGRKGIGISLILWVLTRRGDQYAQLFASKLSANSRLTSEHLPYQ